MPAKDDGRQPHGWITVMEGGEEYSYDLELQKYHAELSYEDCFHRLYSETNGTNFFDGVGVPLFEVAE